MSGNLYCVYDLLNAIGRERLDNDSVSLCVFFRFVREFLSGAPDLAIVQGLLPKDRVENKGRHILFSEHRPPFRYSSILNTLSIHFIRIYLPFFSFNLSQFIISMY